MWAGIQKSGTRLVQENDKDIVLILWVFVIPINLITSYHNSHEPKPPFPRQRNQPEVQIRADALSLKFK